MPHEIVTRRELAALLRVHVSSVMRTLRQHGGPAPLPFAGRRKWLREDINAWLARLAGRQQEAA